MMQNPALDTVTDCDRLAANPPDPDRVAPGVEREDVELAKAIDACRAAVVASPDVGRLSYQLGRCLFYSGQISEALTSFRQAASLGYRQAHFILGLIIQRWYENVPYDLAQIEHHWRLGAELDHANAQVSYVRSALRGDFEGLHNRVSYADMRRFLERAKPKVDYLGSLLVDDLMAALVKANT